MIDQIINPEGHDSLLDRSVTTTTDIFAWLGGFLISTAAYFGALMDMHHPLLIGLTTVLGIATLFIMDRYVFVAYMVTVMAIVIAGIYGIGIVINQLLAF